ncbi:MAG: hypothetical protein MMC23_007464 [Stictis urceolatum]|nr:hypothetical protein [Stictis urceolata]
MLLSGSGSLATLVFSSLAAAVPTELAPRVTANCTDFFIPVHATAPVKQIPLLNIPKNLDNVDVFVDFVTSEASSGLAALLALAGTHETTGDFMMSARYCEPTNKIASRANTIQYLQHAITMTKNYWNGLSYPEGFNGETYSYIDVASDNGYATLSVDNLGSGNSSKPDPVAVVQMSLQVEIIHQIISGLRSGSIAGPVAGKKFDKVIYAGHSYGSISGNALAATYPADADALVLTGYSGEFINGLVPLASGIAIPAALAMPRFLGLPVGYLAQTVVAGRQYGLYTVNGVGGFDPALPTYDYQHEGTVAIGELATLFYGVTPANDFKGSVFVVTGKQDAIVCNEPTGADCGSGATSKPAVAGGFFPNAKDYSYIIPDQTGHNANTHYSSPDSFQKIVQYLAGQGF